jgi:hypothetical protein
MSHVPRPWRSDDASQPERRQPKPKSKLPICPCIRAKYHRDTQQITSFSHTHTPPTMATTTVAKTNSSNMATEQRVQPNQSLYIQNLPEKLQKPDLKRSLYMLFSTFGPVLDVTAVKSSKMRGQAHVLFRDIHAATQAMRACQGMEFFGREMVRCS